MNDGRESYICENGKSHDYSKVDLEKISKDTDGKIYNNVEELKKSNGG